MAGQLDTVADAPAKQLDANIDPGASSKAASQAMYAEVASERSASSAGDIKGSAASSDLKADLKPDSTTDTASSIFGNLTFFDSSKDSIAGAGASTTDAKSGDATAADAASGGGESKSSIGDKITALAGNLGAPSDLAGLLGKSDKGDLPVQASLFGFGEPSDDDKKALRDMVHDVREKVSEQLEPEKKAKVDELANGIKDDKERDQFKKDIETIEHRNPPISQAERGRLYSQIEKLMTAPDNANVPLTAQDRTHLAEQIVHKAADPTAIDQGTKGTCNVATVEARTFTRDPAAAAKVIVDVATTGEYTAPDGTKVKPDPGSIKGDIEVQNPGGYFKNPRDHADQLFQVTAVNAAWQTHDLTVTDAQGRTNTYPKGTVEYRQTDPVTGQQNGEGLYDKSKNLPQLIQDHGQDIHDPHLNGNQITDVANLISGRDDKDFVIEHGGSNAADKTFKVNSEAELKEKLKSMKEHGELPAIIMVNTGNPPFWGENISLSPGFIPPKSGINGEHVVTVTDYDEKTGLVSLDNQWGKGKDHIGGSGISAGDLYIATMPPGSPETISILDRDVKWNRDHNTVNTSKELELLQQKFAAHQMSKEDYKKQVDATMDDAQKRWKANGTSENDVERQQAEEYYAKINKSQEDIHFVHGG